MKQSNPKRLKLSLTEPEYVGVDGAEALSGLSCWTWRRYSYKRKVASVKVGKRLLIPISEIRRVMAAGLRPALENKNGR